MDGCHCIFVFRFLRTWYEVWFLVLEFFDLDDLGLLFTSCRSRVVGLGS